MATRAPLLRRSVIAFSVRSRRRKAALILRYITSRGVTNAVFVGCSPGRNPNEAIVENAVAGRAEVLLACDVLECDVPWPFLVADGRDLPLPTDYTDLVLANAVIEHVGDESDQRRFVLEQTRVGRSWVITTPNRWFPVEAHTSQLLLHWSPTWRRNRREFTRLLSRREFAALLPDDTEIVGRPWSATFTAFHPAPARHWRREPGTDRKVLVTGQLS